MSQPETPPQLRDDRAGDRDDSAGRRDDLTRDRDDAAVRRDADAEERDDAARDGSDDLVERVRRIRPQILERFARIENSTVDPHDWPDLTPAALAHLDAHTAEQRRLAGLDREAVADLLDHLDDGLGHPGRDRRASARDRDASARDRHHSAGDRDHAHQDRHLSARDRSQAAIEREQVDPGGLPPDGGAGRHP